MKKSLIILMAHMLVLTSVTAMAEAPRNGGGRGNGTGNGSMQTLNEGIAYMNGDGVEQDYKQAVPFLLYPVAAPSRVRIAVRIDCNPL